MFKKIVFCLILGFIIIAVVAAADTTSFKVPADFDDVGDGVYVLYDDSKNPLQILSVVEFNEHDAEDYMDNDTENNYSVVPYENDTFNFVDGSMNEQGSFEFIEVDGDKFIIDFARFGIDEKNNFEDTFQNLLEFNKLNNVTPINATNLE